MLTKPLGFGVTTTALKREIASAEDVAEVVGWMKQLNAGAAQLANEFSLHCATDITGYSLLGHGLEVANASQVGLRLHFGAIPFVSGARKYAEGWHFPGGAHDNAALFRQPGASSQTVSTRPTGCCYLTRKLQADCCFRYPRICIDGLLARAR